MWNSSVGEFGVWREAQVLLLSDTVDKLDHTCPLLMILLILLLHGINPKFWLCFADSETIWILPNSLIHPSTYLISSNMLFSLQAFSSHYNMFCPFPCEQLSLTNQVSSPMSYSKKKKCSPLQLTFTVASQCTFVSVLSVSFQKPSYRTLHSTIFLSTRHRV